MRAILWRRTIVTANVGRVDPNGAIWLRDAVAHRHLQSRHTERDDGELERGQGYCDPVAPTGEVTPGRRWRSSGEPQTRTAILDRRLLGTELPADLAAFVLLFLLLMVLSVMSWMDVLPSYRFCSNRVISTVLRKLSHEASMIRITEGFS